MSKAFNSCSKAFNYVAKPRIKEKKFQNIRLSGSYVLLSPLTGGSSKGFQKGG